jgi:hypothetical protein
MVQFAFNAGQIPPEQGREAIPAGWYIGMINKSEVKQTKKKDGFFLEIGIVIVDGIYKDAVITERFNINNKNAEAQKIGLGQLSALCHAINVMVMEDTQQLHNLPFKVKLKVNPAEGEYAASNEAVMYKPLSYEIPPEQNQTAPVATTAQPWAAPATATQQPAAQPWAQPVTQQAQPAAPAQQPWAAPAAPQQAAPAAQPWAQQPAAPVQQQAAPQPQAGAAGDIPPWMRQS